MPHFCLHLRYWLFAYSSFFNHKIFARIGHADLDELQLEALLRCLIVTSRYVRVIYTAFADLASSPNLKTINSRDKTMRYGLIFLARVSRLSTDLRKVLYFLLRWPSIFYSNSINRLINFDNSLILFIIISILIRKKGKKESLYQILE
jgi:hypothetical protein